MIQPSTGADGGVKMKRTNAGFSLVEMLVAVTVMGISLLGLAQLLGVAIQQNSSARYNTAAVEVARGKLEQLKAEYNRQLETGVSMADLTDGEHGPVEVALPSHSSQYSDRSVVMKWWVSSPSATRKNIGITVWPSGVSTDDANYVKLRAKAITVNTVLTP